MSAAEPCLCCKKAKLASPAVVVVTIWTDTLLRGYPIILAEDYSICLHPDCESVALFVSRCASGHHAVKNEGTWRGAVLTFADKRSLKVELERKTASARA